MDELYFCRKCSSPKLLEEMSSKNHLCLKCAREKMEAWRKANPERFKELRRISRNKRVSTEEGKERQRSYAKEHYQKNKQRYFANNTRSLNKQRKWFSDWKKQQKCCRCGFDDYRALVLHHLRDKIGNVSDLIRKAVGIKRLQEEIDKCEVLCANCHHIEHYKEFE